MDKVTLISSDDEDNEDILFVPNAGSDSRSEKKRIVQSTKKSVKKAKPSSASPIYAASVSVVDGIESAQNSSPTETSSITESPSIRAARENLKIVEKELKYVDSKIEKLLSYRDQKQQEKDDLERMLEIKIGQSIMLGGKLDPTDLSVQEFDDPDRFPWSKDIRNKLKSLWNIEKFRFNQLPVINATLSNRDAMVLMPTGGGKSLCYQLPAIINTLDKEGKLRTDKITIVITPLISLIKDQLFDLKKLGIPATGLFGASTKEHRQAITSILKSLDKGEQALRDLGLTESPRLLYVTPEQIAKSKRFLSCLEKAYRDGKLARFVIDECHCCSQSGHDFRPDYKKLSVLRTLFPQVSILALTATCSPSVMESVMTILGLRSSSGIGDCLVFKSPLSRDNLSYSVIPKPALAKDVISAIVEFIQKRHKNSTGIIYCLSRKDTEVVASEINQSAGRSIPTRAYHADMDEDEKHSIHTAWRAGTIKVVVATVAFGLGINHPDVRFVIHHTMSKSLDGYYQESGRAGRDGLPSECVLFFRGADIFRVTGMAVTEPEGLEHSYAMVRYAMSRERCRKELILDYFSTGNIILSLKDTGLVTPKCTKCDICQQKSTSSVVDVSQEALNIIRVLQALSSLNTLEASPHRVTCNQLVTYLKTTGSIPACLLSLRDQDPPVLPFKKSVSKEQCEAIVLRLLMAGHIKEDFHFTSYSSISYLVATPLGRRALNYPDTFKVILEFT